MQDEAEVGLAGAMIDEVHAATFGNRVRDQWLNELRQVINLFELAPRILIHPAVDGEDMQRLEQLDRLAGPYFWRQRLCARPAGLARGASRAGG